jgi:hypothetical protein
MAYEDMALRQGMNQENNAVQLAGTIPNAPMSEYAAMANLLSTGLL